MIQHIEMALPEFKRGFHLITEQTLKEIEKLPQSGLLQIFCRHTSCALSLNENCDPSVRDDLNRFIDYLIPETKFDYTHTAEGEDDMPAHIKATIIGAHLSIPIINGKLALGTWQGIYLCEFRNSGGPRKLILSIIS
jgi:secondary thiamine-phosphate synthase enzyme